MNNQLINARIKARDWLTPRILRISIQSEVALEYLPGQFISVHLPAADTDSDLVRRSYSIACRHSQVPTTEIEIVLGVLADGLASQFFAKCSLGDTLKISGPYGALTLPDEIPQRVFLVATSTGAAPFRNMLDSIGALFEAGCTRDFELLLGVQTHEEALFADEFRAFAEQYPHVQFNLCLSREKATSSDEFEGYVQQRLETLAPGPERDSIFLCGNPKMVDTTFKLLVERGFSPRQVRREKYVHSRR